MLGHHNILQKQKDCVRILRVAASTGVAELVPIRFGTLLQISIIVWVVPRVAWDFLSQMKCLLKHPLKEQQACSSVLKGDQATLCLWEVNGTILKEYQSIPASMVHTLYGEEYESAMRILAVQAVF